MESGSLQVMQSWMQVIKLFAVMASGALGLGMVFVECVVDK
jgi:hypothetical protein